MLSYIKGTVISKLKDDLIIRVGDLGYRITVTPIVFAETKIDADIELYLHEAARENSIEHYGVKTLDELDLFESLISVSGVGPKSGLAILGLAPAAALRSAISRGEADTLTKVSGIGRKTAERVILELRNKMGSISEAGVISSGGSDELDALMALGYSAPQARDALAKVDATITDSGERIKQALKNI
ncbi:MAG: Holliday junction branch migration protein RuvA [Candidatus Falkowbacteria bacterium]|nr:Holliday junction branch migration protein RuvA [Candidatus Falkowbacteria bacterium]